MAGRLGSLLPVLVLIGAPVALLGTACGGDDSDDVAQDPAPASPAASTSTASSQPSPTLPGSSGDSGSRVVDIITVTAAGGTVDTDAVPMDDDAARASFLAQFTAGDLAGQVQQEVDSTDVPDGERLYAAVVAVGCDAPTDVSVLYSLSAVSVTAVQVASPKPECLAPMTSVALVQVSTAGGQVASPGDGPPS